MSLALVLALLAADPQAATAPAPAAVARPDSDPLPAGAPADDFRFVAWCHGVLSGHMDLADRVKAELPVDDVQQSIGRAYLDGYERALANAPESRTEAGREAARRARADGWSNWEKARNADIKLASDTYLAWSLPGRCEHAAVRLAGDPSIFKLNDDITAALGQEVLFGKGGAVTADIAGSRASASTSALAANQSADQAREPEVPDFKAPPSDDAPTTTAPTATAPTATAPTATTETPAMTTPAVAARKIETAPQPKAATASASADGQGLSRFIPGFLKRKSDGGAKTAAAEADAKAKTEPEAVASGNPRMPSKGRLLPGFLRR